MKTIEELVQEIRDFINSQPKQHTLRQRTASWNMLCSCLDLIGDTELAISSYYNTTADGEYVKKYLLVYGILQSLFLQQDAVQNLCDALELSYTPDPLLFEIRKIRNDSVGHPTKRGDGQGTTYNFISRASLSKSGFDLMTTYPDERLPIFRHVSIPSLIEEQHRILQRSLSEVVEKLRKEEAVHRAMFKTERLQDVFPPALHYFFEKIFEAIDGNKPNEFGSIHIKLIAEAVDTFKIRLGKRGALEAYDSITYLLDLLEYPINELSSYFTGPNNSRLNDKSANIFAFFIKKHTDKLIEIAKEIDEEYESEP